MKIKVILAPLLIVMTVILIIWFVYPAYSNGSDGLKDQLQVLDKENKKLESINSIGNVVEKINKDITDNKVSADLLYNYLPDNPKEEEIIDNINYLAASNGLSISDLSVSYTPNQALTGAVQPPSPAVPASESILPSPSGNTAANPELAEVPQTRTSAEDIKVSVSVSGPYEKIKDFFKNLYEFKRYNIVTTANVSAEKSKDGGNTDQIRADAVFSFNVLGRISEVNNPTDEIFYRGSLDLKTIDSINTIRKVDILKLQLDQQGKSNPFLP